MYKVRVTIDALLVQVLVGPGLRCLSVPLLQGGMKAVIWTDTFQMVIILGGLVAVIVEGTIDCGGPGNVITRVIDGDRIYPGR